MDDIDDRFLTQCWEDVLRGVNLPGTQSHDNKLLSKFRNYGPNQRQIAEYIFMLHAHRAAGNRASDSEWAWRWGLFIAFALIALGNFLQIVIEGVAVPTVMFVVNLLAAFVVLISFAWRGMHRHS